MVSLTEAQRRAARRALGEERLHDLLPLLARLDDDFRASFLVQLERVRPRRAPDAVVLAFARAVLELSRQARR